MSNLDAVVLWQRDDAVMSVGAWSRKYVVSDAGRYTHVRSKTVDAEEEEEDFKIEEDDDVSMMIRTTTTPPPQPQPVESSDSRKQPVETIQSYQIQCQVAKVVQTTSTVWKANAA